MPGAGDAEKYISGSNIRTTFGISASTLRNWANAGAVQTIRFGKIGKRLYLRTDIEKAFRGYRAPANRPQQAEISKTRVCYCRSPQRDDLARQEEALRREYPEHEIVKDIGSALDWKRPGLLSMVDRAMHGLVSEVVVSHRDRLCRVGFEFVKHVLSQSGCTLLVQHDEEGVGDDPTELRDDLLSIVTALVASNNGKRAAAHRRERKRTAAEREERQGEAPTGDEMQESIAAPDERPANPPEPVEGRSALRL